MSKFERRVPAEFRRLTPEDRAIFARVGLAAHLTYTSADYQSFVIAAQRVRDGGFVNSVGDDIGATGMRRIVLRGAGIAARILKQIVLRHGDSLLDDGAQQS